MADSPITVLFVAQESMGRQILTSQLSIARLSGTAAF